MRVVACQTFLNVLTESDKPDSENASHSDQEYSRKFLYLRFLGCLYITLQSWWSACWFFKKQRTLQCLKGTKKESCFTHQAFYGNEAFYGIGDLTDVAVGPTPLPWAFIWLSGMPRCGNCSWSEFIKPSHKPCLFFWLINVDFTFKVKSVRDQSAGSK